MLCVILRVLLCVLFVISLVLSSSEFLFAVWRRNTEQVSHSREQWIICRHQGGGSDLTCRWQRGGACNNQGDGACGSCDQQGGGACNTCDQQGGGACNTCDQQGGGAHVTCGSRQGGGACVTREWSGEFHHLVSAPDQAPWQNARLVNSLDFVCVCVCVCAVSYTHLTLPTRR